MTTVTGEPDVTEIEGWQPDTTTSTPSAPPPAYSESTSFAKPREVSSTYCYDCDCDPKEGVKYCCRPPTFIFCIALVIHIGLLFGIWFGVIQKNLNDREAFTASTCHAMSYAELPFRCCKTGDCACDQCNLMQPSCDNPQLVQQKLNQSTCCGSSCCAQRCCSTCCSQKCDSDGKNCHMVCVSCNCYCCRPISQETCAFRCGTCFTIGVTFELAFNNRIYTRQFSCDLDEWTCKNDLSARYGVSSNSWDCWYDERNPDVIPRFDGIPGLAKTAIAFFAIFCFTFVVSVVVWQVALCKY